MNIDLQPSEQTCRTWCSICRVLQWASLGDSQKGSTVQHLHKSNGCCLRASKRNIQGKLPCFSMFVLCDVSLMNRQVPHFQSSSRARTATAAGIASFELFSAPLLAHMVPFHSFGLLAAGAARATFTEETFPHG